MAVVDLVVIDSSTFRVVTSSNSTSYLNQYITLTLTHPYQLYSSLSTRLLQNASALTSLPVQNSQASVYLTSYTSYSKDQRRTGMQLMQLAMSVCMGALMLWLLAVLKNLRCTSLVFVSTLQWLHSLSLMEYVLPPNIGQFLEGLKLANLFFGSPGPTSRQ
jgi:hypothetical protein